MRIALETKPQMIGIEANIFADLLAGEWNRQSRAAGLITPPSSITNTVHKHVRIRTIGSHLAQRKIRFNAHSWGARDLVNQLRDFPIGDHDHGPDALEMALRLLADLKDEDASAEGPSHLPLESI